VVVSPAVAGGPLFAAADSTPCIKAHPTIAGAQERCAERHHPILPFSAKRRLFFLLQEPNERIEHARDHGTLLPVLIGQAFALFQIAFEIL